MFERIIHRWLRIPHTLHVHYFHAPKKPKKTILLLHGLGTSWKTWEPVAAKLPTEYRVIAVDLLGFGKSPKPDWKDYDVAAQARSIALTLAKKGIISPMIVVGHSMGALVAIELAKHRHPVFVKSLVLCSPPIYHPQFDTKIRPERVLRRLYRFVHQHPNASKKLLRMADRYNLWPDRGFQADGMSAHSFLNALSAAVINQTTIKDIGKLTIPISILSGKLDPLIIEANLKQLAKTYAHISHASMLTQGHEITNPYAKRAVKLILQQAATKR